MRHCLVQAQPQPFVSCCGCAPLNIPLAIHAIPSQSLDAVVDQRGLVSYLPGAVSASDGKDQQQQQDDEHQGADCYQGVGDHPQDGLLQHPARAVGCHVCGRERPCDL